MSFGRACQESTIEGKLFKFHWHRASYLRFPSNLPHAHSLTRVHVSIVVRRVRRTRWHATHTGNGTRVSSPLRVLLDSS